MSMIKSFLWPSGNLHCAWVETIPKRENKLYAKLTYLRNSVIYVFFENERVIS